MFHYNIYLKKNKFDNFEKLEPAQFLFLIIFQQKYRLKMMTSKTKILVKIVTNKIL